MFSRWKRKKGELSRVESSRVELVPCSGKAALCRFSTAHVARLDTTRLDTTRHGSSAGPFPPQIVPPGRGRGRLRERAVTYFCTRRKQHLRNPHMDRTHITTMEDIDNITIISWHVEEVEEVEYVGCGAAMAVTSMVAMSLS